MGIKVCCKGVWDNLIIDMDWTLEIGKSCSYSKHHLVKFETQDLIADRILYTPVLIRSQPFHFGYETFRL